MRYVVPATASKRTRLRPPPALSSSEATGVSVATSLPVYTARTVSKLLPRVSKVAGPAEGAVHENQTDAAARRPACAGSFASAVADAVDCVSEPLAPLRGRAVAKRSFGGAPAGCTVHVRVAGVGSVFPPASVARTLNVCVPAARSEETVGLVQ